MISGYVALKESENVHFMQSGTQYWIAQFVFPITNPEFPPFLNIAVARYGY